MIPSWNPWWLWRLLPYPIPFPTVPGLATVGAIGINKSGGAAQLGPSVSAGGGGQGGTSVTFSSVTGDFSSSWVGIGIVVSGGGQSGSQPGARSGAKPGTGGTMANVRA